MGPVRSLDTFRRCLRRVGEASMPAASPAAPPCCPPPCCCPGFRWCGGDEVGKPALLCAAELPREPRRTLAADADSCEGRGAGGVSGPAGGGSARRWRLLGHTRATAVGAVGIPRRVLLEQVQVVQPAGAEAVASGPADEVRRPRLRRPLDEPEAVLRVPLRVPARVPFLRVAPMAHEPFGSQPLSSPSQAPPGGGGAARRSQGCPRSPSSSRHPRASAKEAAPPPPPAPEAWTGAWFGRRRASFAGTASAAAPLSRASRAGAARREAAPSEARPPGGAGKSFIMSPPPPLADEECGASPAALRYGFVRARR